MKRGLQLHVEHGTFEAMVALAIGQISHNRHTVDAYWRDVMRWLDFCHRRNIDPRAPRRQEVSAWMDEMREAGVKPKSRARRMSSLCSVYRELRRELTDREGNEIQPVVTVRNPFSIDDGPRRERGNPGRPTPVARPDVVQAVLATCDDSVIGVRDRALMRVLWATGIRRSTAAGMTVECLEQDREGYAAVLETKGSKQIRILVRGKAAGALSAWLETLKKDGITSGPLWRTKRGEMTPHGIYWMLRKRASKAKVPGITPHMLRVSFLTYNKAGLEARQDAAGHADPATTRMYDRAGWKGRDAFEQMPEVEDAE